MLNKFERYEVLKIWKLFSILGQLPVEVDLTNWRLNVPKIKKKWICAVYYSLHVLHVLFKLSSLVYNILFVPDLQLHQLVIHAVLAIGTGMFALWYSIVYINDPGLFAAYVELTLVGNVGGTSDLNDGLKKHWTRRLWEYSMQDLIATCSPYACMTTGAVIGAVYVYDPSMQILVYNSLPTYLQNWATFGILLVEEVRFVMMNTCIAVPIWQCQVISFDLMSNRLLALKRKIEKGTVTRMTTYRGLRALQLYVSIFNQVNSYVIFTWKLLSITGAILTGFAAVAHFSDYPMFGVMYYAILMNCVFLYAFIYEKASKIPRLFEETTSCARLHMCGSRKDIYRKKISSIPSAAITVGRFHKIERASTMIYMNFVVTNIVSLLVAFG